MFFSIYSDLVSNMFRSLADSLRRPRIVSELSDIYLFIFRIYESIFYNVVFSPVLAVF